MSATLGWIVKLQFKLQSLHIHSLGPEDSHIHFPPYIFFIFWILPCSFCISPIFRGNHNECLSVLSENVLTLPCPMDSYWVCFLSVSKFWKQLFGHSIVSEYDWFNSNEVLQIDPCFLAHSSVNAIVSLPAFSQHVSSYSCSFWNEKYIFRLSRLTDIIWLTPTSAIKISAKDWTLW